jgi:hypothetical protein
MTGKKILICLLISQTLIPLVNAKSLQSDSKVMQEKSTQTLWTDTEVKALVDELNVLSQRYITEAWSSGWNCGYGVGFENGKSFITANPPFTLKARYCIFGFCTGLFTAGTTGILWKMR